MKVSIKNYRAVAESSIELSPLALVAANNEGGKTSTAQAVASLVLGESVVLEGVKKSEMGLLVRTGSSKAELTIEHEGGSATLNLPPGRYESKGGHPPKASHYALGIKSVLDLDPADRAKALIEFLKADVTKEDLTARVKEIAVKLGNVKAAEDGTVTLTKAQTDYIEKLWATIAEIGWDNAHASYEETGKRMKGQWEQLTGERRYGSAKASNWIPEGWSTDLTSASVQALEQAVNDESSMVDSAISGSALNSEERTRLENLRGNIPQLEAKVATEKQELVDMDASVEYARQKSLAANKGTLADDVAAAKKEVGDYQQLIDETQAKLDALGSAKTSTTVLPNGGTRGNCPYKECGKPIMYHGEKFRIPPTAQDVEAEKAVAKHNNEIGRVQAALDTHRRRHTEWVGKLAVAEQKLADAEAFTAEFEKLPTPKYTGEGLAAKRDEMQRHLGALESELTEARGAKEKLLSMPDEKANEEQVNHARERLQVAKARLDAFKRKTDADRKAAAILFNSEIVHALASTGLRQHKLSDRLAEINKKLGFIAAKGNFKPVEITKELDFQYGGWPYLLISEAAQYRVRAVMQMLMAVTDKSDIVILDRVDVLDLGGRNGLLKILAWSKKKGLLLMTEKRERVPDLAKAGLGNSYWIENGVAAPLSEAAKVAA